VSLVTAGIHMQRINPHFFQLLSNPQPFFLLPSAFKVMGDAEAVDNRKILTGITLNGRNRFPARVSRFSLEPP